MVNWVSSDTLNTFGSPEVNTLFLHTNDYHSSQGKTYLVKYADDTVLLSLLSHLDQEYGLGFFFWWNSI